MVELYQQESQCGRKVLLFISNTQRRDITPRLKWVLEKHTTARVSVLKSGSPAADKREEWVQDRLREGFDLLEVHPRCVQTGLDLLDFPTIVFFQIEYSTQVMRQASRRSWRIGQKCPVDVYYYGYRFSAQEQALRLMAKKVRASLSLEGDLETAGLVGLADEDEDEGESLLSLATELLNAGKSTVEQRAGAEIGIGEFNGEMSLEAIFNSLHAQELEAARFVLEDADATEAALEAAIESVYAATTTTTAVAPLSSDDIVVAQATATSEVGREVQDQMLLVAPNTVPLTIAPTTSTFVVVTNAGDDQKPGSTLLPTQGVSGKKRPSFEELRAAMLAARQQKLEQKARRKQRKSKGVVVAEANTIKSQTSPIHHSTPRSITKTEGEVQQLTFLDFLEEAAHSEQAARKDEAAGATASNAEISRVEQLSLF